CLLLFSALPVSSPFSFSFTATAPTELSTLSLHDALPIFTRSVGASVPLLGQVPLEQAVREHGDAGTPMVLAEPDSPSGRAYLEIADGLAVRPRGLAGMNLGIDTTRNF